MGKNKKKGKRNSQLNKKVAGSEVTATTAVDQPTEKQLQPIQKKEQIQPIQQEDSSNKESSQCNDVEEGTIDGSDIVTSETNKPEVLNNDNKKSYKDKKATRDAITLKDSNDEINEEIMQMNENLMGEPPQPSNLSDQRLEENVDNTSTAQVSKNEETTSDLTSKKKDLLVQNQQQTQAADDQNINDSQSGLEKKQQDQDSQNEKDLTGDTTVLAQMLPENQKMKYIDKSYKEHDEPSTLFDNETDLLSSEAQIKKKEESTTTETHSEPIHTSQDKAELENRISSSNSTIAIPSAEVTQAVPINAASEEKSTDTAENESQFLPQQLPQQRSEQQPQQEAKILSGPFSLEPLIDNITLTNPEIPESANSKITCLSAYAENLYIGTLHGEILHYYKLDAESGYIMISRQRAHATKAKPINKILLLPQVSRALVLNGSMINVFILPELSPANMGKIKDVHDLAVDVDNFNVDEQFEEVPVILFTKKMIRIINVSPTTLKLVKDINYPNTIKGLRRSKFSLVATKTNYDLIDIDSFQKIPLLPVCSLAPEEIKIKPFILPILKDEYLITCGLTKTEPAMGMIVNNNGDISRGTIPWVSYPTSIAVSFPYTLAIFSNNNNNTNEESLKYQLKVHSIYDLSDCQTMEFSNEVQVTTVAKQFEEPYESLIDIVKRVPLVIAEDDKLSNYYNDNHSEEKQKAELEKIKPVCKISSSVLVYSPHLGQIKVVKSLPALIRLNKLAESFDIKELQQEYDDFIKDYTGHGPKEVNLSDRITFQFLRNALSLMLMVDKNFGDSYRLWINQYDNIDVKILKKLLLDEEIDFTSTDKLVKTTIGDLQLRMDPRIVVYLFNQALQKEAEKQEDGDSKNGALYGQFFNFNNVWIHNGLRQFVDKLLEQGLENDLIRFYIKVLTNWLNQRDKIVKELNMGAEDKSDKQLLQLQVPGSSSTTRPDRSGSFDQKEAKLNEGNVAMQKSKSSRSDSSRGENRNVLSSSKHSISDTNLVSSDVSNVSDHSIMSAENPSTLRVDNKDNSSEDGLKIPIIVNRLTINDLQGVPQHLFELFKTIEIILLRHNIAESFKFKTDKHLLLFINKNIKTAVNESIKILKHYNKHLILLQVYESLNQNGEYLKTWKGLIEGELKDPEFPVTDEKSLNLEIKKMHEKVLLMGNKYDMDVFEFYRWLINIDKIELFVSVIFTLSANPVTQLVQQAYTAKVLQLLTGLNNQQLQNSQVKVKTVNELKIAYLEYTFSHGYKEFFGVLVNEYIIFLINFVQQNNAITEFVDAKLKEYKGIQEFPKLSSKQYLKVQMKIASENKAVLRLNDVNIKLLNFLQVIGLNDRIILVNNTDANADNSREPISYSISGKKFLARCHEKLEQCENVFFANLMVIESKCNEFEKVAGRLMQLTDFTSAERYIVSGGEMLFEAPVVKEHYKRNDDANNGSDATLPKIGEEQIKEQVLKLYQCYLENHSDNQLLIEHFLQNYGHTLDFHFLLTHIPESSSLKLLSKTVLVQNLISLNDEYTNSLVKKNLVRSELNFYSKLLKQLKGTR